MLDAHWGLLLRGSGAQTKSMRKQTKIHRSGRFASEASTLFLTPPLLARKSFRATGF